MRGLTRRTALAGLGAGGGVLALGYLLRGAVSVPLPNIRLVDNGCAGLDPADLNRYNEMFNRHSEIIRTVEEIPGGIRTVTQSNSPDLTALLQAHVSSMYARLDQGAEVMCMSASLPTLFRRAGGYRRRLTITPTGVMAEETADDAVLVQAIRSHADEVSGFVRDGMPPMMKGMMCPGMMRR
jgi:hypothetical protein